MLINFSLPDMFDHQTPLISWDLDLKTVISASEEPRK